MPGRWWTPAAHGPTSRARPSTTGSRCWPRLSRPGSAPAARGRRSGRRCSPSCAARCSTSSPPATPSGPPRRSRPTSAAAEPTVPCCAAPANRRRVAPCGSVSHPGRAPSRPSLRRPGPARRFAAAPAVREAADVAAADPDLALRQAAVGRARQLAQAYDDLVPLARLREGFEYGAARVSFGSFQKGIHRSRQQRGPAALTVTTSFTDPYADAFDEAGALFTYAYRSGPVDQADNRALRAAFELQTPLVYFRALAPGQYLVVAPMFVTADDSAARMVVLEPGLPVQDMQPGGLVSGPEVRAYATREARYRLHQQRFKLDVMRAYRHRCAICTLRERELVQAAHIVPDSEGEGIAAVVNGLALCAIHHLAFDRNLLGIAPDGVVHIAGRVLRETDGPMLRTGPQGFHGGRIAMPRRPEDRPDPHRLEVRFERFSRAAA